MLPMLPSLFSRILKNLEPDSLKMMCETWPSVETKHKTNSMTENCHVSKRSLFDDC